MKAFQIIVWGICSLTLIVAISIVGAELLNVGKELIYWVLTE